MVDAHCGSSHVAPGFTVLEVCENGVKSTILVPLQGCRGPNDIVTTRNDSTTGTGSGVENPVVIFDDSESIFANPVTSTGNPLCPLPVSFVTYPANNFNTFQNQRSQSSTTILNSRKEKTKEDISSIKYIINHNNGRNGANGSLDMNKWSSTDLNTFQSSTMPEGRTNLTPLEYAMLTQRASSIILAPSSICTDTSPTNPTLLSQKLKIPPENCTGLPTVSSILSDTNNQSQNVLRAEWANFISTLLNSQSSGISSNPQARLPSVLNNFNNNTSNPLLAQVPVIKQTGNQGCSVYHPDMPPRTGINQADSVLTLSNLPASFQVLPSNDKNWTYPSLAGQPSVAQPLIGQTLFVSGPGASLDVSRSTGLNICKDDAFSSQLQAINKSYPLTMNGCINIRLPTLSIPFNCAPSAQFNQFPGVSSGQPIPAHRRLGKLAPKMHELNKSHEKVLAKNLSSRIVAPNIPNQQVGQSVFTEFLPQHLQAYYVPSINNNMPIVLKSGLGLNALSDNRDSHSSRQTAEKQLEQTEKDKIIVSEVGTADKYHDHTSYSYDRPCILLDINNGGIISPSVLKIPDMPKSVANDEVDYQKTFKMHCGSKKESSPKKLKSSNLVGPAIINIPHSPTHLSDENETEIDEPVPAKGVLVRFLKRRKRQRKKFYSVKRTVGNDGNFSQVSSVRRLIASKARNKFCSVLAIRSKEEDDMLRTLSTSLSDPRLRYCCEVLLEKLRPNSLVNRRIRTSSRKKRVVRYTELDDEIEDNTNDIIWHYVDEADEVKQNEMTSQQFTRTTLSDSFEVPESEANC